MSIPQHRGGKVYCPKRDENEPVGNISGRAHGSGRAGSRITTLLLDEPVLMVAVADDGQVFAVDPNGLRAQAITSQHPGWIVGTYTSRCGGGTIAGDLRVQAKGLRRKAA